eukprot:3230301-Rhodomonas_salina.1
MIDLEQAPASPTGVSSEWEDTAPNWTKKWFSSSSLCKQAEEEDDLAHSNSLDERSQAETLSFPSSLNEQTEAFSAPSARPCGDQLQKTETRSASAPESNDKRLVELEKQLRGC